MLSKKPGPPVPPRPSATVHTATQLTAKSSISTKVSPMPHGRTVIYKSPWLDTSSQSQDHSNSFKQLIDHDHQKATVEFSMNDSFSFKVNTTQETATPSVISLSTLTSHHSTTEQRELFSKTSTTSTTIQCNTTQPHIIRRAELAFPPAPPLRTLDHTSGSSIDNPSPPPTATRTKTSTITTPSSYENIAIEQYRSKTDLDTDHRRSVKYEANPLDENENDSVVDEVKKSPVAMPRMNAPPVQRRVLQPVNAVKLSTGTNLDQGHTIDALLPTPDAQPFEKIKNLRNSTYKLVAEKLFTEIATNAQSGQAKLEHCIPVRTPSPPRFQIKADRASMLGDISSMDTLPIANKINESLEKKVTFHEMLISELTGMRQPPKIEPTPYSEAPVVSTALAPSTELSSIKPIKEKRCRRYSSSGSADSASSPNGTQRMARIRTADWVEVGDNGKEVLLSSCQISLEDSGLEDEERLDDGSSGVGDSWDSVRDIEDR